MMRRTLLFSLSSALLFAQQAPRRISSATYDLNGRPVAGATVVESRSDAEYRRTEMVQSLNGRSVPVESVQERTVSEEGGTKVVERIVRRFDANGQPGPPERSIIEQRINADGTGNILETRYRADVNGRQQLWERLKTEITREGNTERSEVQVERPGPNAAIELVEKKTAVTRTTGQGSEQDVVTYRRGESGRLYQAARQVTERTKTGDQTVENLAHYEAQTPGQLQLTGQIVKRTVEQEGGTRTEVDVYSSDIAGRPHGKPQLKERQLIERKPASGDGFVESVSVRRPSVNDPHKLGAAQKVSEIVCTGECAEKKAPVPEPAAEAQP